MILKHREKRNEDIQELNRLLTLNLSVKQRFLVERELKCLLSGNSGENSSAYYLDFNYKDSKNWVVIHDLRLEHRGLVAQIDHILINRFLEIYVLESKNYFYGIKITDNGEFMAFTGKAFQGIESPIEQNKRHVHLLQKTIDDRNLAPTRLGISLPITYKNYVLVTPNARIDRPKQNLFDTANVIKADAFVSQIHNELDRMSVVATFAVAAKFIGPDALEEFGHKLTKLHRPGTINYVAKFGIDEGACLQTLIDKPVVDMPESIVYKKLSDSAKDKPVCKYCQSENINIVYGKYGYYFKCNDCNGNTTIKISCGKDGHSERIRKEGQKFFRECSGCGTSSLFFVNK